VLRLVPVAGLTIIKDLHPTHPATPPQAANGRWEAWTRQLGVLAGGVLATLALAGAVTAVVAVWERARGTRCVWGRVVIADALVLSVFNFLPVPPLDGGQAVLGAAAAWRGAPLTGDALLWVHVGGLALAVVPMALWTGWTAYIDRVAMRWGAPPHKPRDTRENVEPAS
jgi:Zn-dependent protease